MAYWILKTEPETYSFEKLLKDKQTNWDGVRNYQARNNLKAMKKGDQCMIYHSVGPKEIVGLAEVSKEAFIDPTDTEKKWIAVEIAPIKKLHKPVTLAQIKEAAQLEEIALVKQSRLSVCPVTKAQWDIILKMAS